MYLGTVLQFNVVYYWDLCYINGINVICGTGKNISPMIRFKIKASYIVSTEGYARKVNDMLIYNNLSKRYTHPSRRRASFSFMLNKSPRCTLQ